MDRATLQRIGKLGLVTMLATASLRAFGQDLPDYTLFDQTIALHKFRAGTHDESGQNDYYFRATMYGILNTLEERKKSIKDRQNIPVALGEFGEIQLASLSFLKLEKDAKDSAPPSLSIEGTGIRELTSQCMHKFNATEDKIAVMVKIELFERGKRFKFFGEDLLVGSTMYFPIPTTKYDVPGRTNLALTISDNKGAWAGLHVDYKDHLGKGERVNYPVDD